VAKLLVGRSPDRGMKRAGFRVLTDTYKSMLSILLEELFIDEKRDNDLLRDETWAESYSQAIGEGIGTILTLPRRTIVSVGSDITAPPNPAIQPGVMFRVVAGSYASRENAERQMARLREAGFDAFIEAFQR
jgi:N-acetylmuramoyl-L-alanine amidase